MIAELQTAAEETQRQAGQIQKLWCHSFSFFCLNARSALEQLQSVRAAAARVRLVALKCKRSRRQRRRRRGDHVRACMADCAAGSEI